MDAFGTAHRAEASTHGVGKFAPVACAGLLLTEELDALNKALANPARPMVAIVGGSKVSTKLTVLEALSEKVDQLVVGGGIANTFLAAAGKNVGKSLCEARPDPHRPGPDEEDDRPRRHHPDRGRRGRAARSSTRTSRPCSRTPATWPTTT